MAASLVRTWVTGVRGLLRSRAALPPEVRALCSPPEEFDLESRYKEHPWEYLSSEEYLQRYGQKSVWTGYRRNHKGPIPPQKTRKTCIRGGKACGNPCPICRDQNLGVDYRNVKLLQQFICPHTGVVYDPTRTGVCMKQHKRLVKAITEAEDQGLLPVLVQNKDISFGDYSRTHSAVAPTPPPPLGPWYSWYEWQEPSTKDVTKLQNLYRPYWKQMTGGQ